MKKLTTEEMHRMTVDEFRESEKLPLVVVLDNVRSLNNVGSVFRTSDAFRVERICLCGITATPPHREIHKTALGAEDSVAWSYYEDTHQCLRDLKADGYKIFAVEQVDDSIKLGSPTANSQQLIANSQKPIANSQQPTANSQQPIAIIFGNEIDGVQETLLPLCDACLEIPQYGTKHSLNVSCAAAIVIWEMFKKLKTEN